jgi:predicted 3-demethylubiquinone-9 3-methyltransferase (glyoxalase superfamily)
MGQPMTKTKNMVCIWYADGAAEAAAFYTDIFPDTKINAVHLAPADYPFGVKDQILTVDFHLMGIPCLGLNGGNAFPQTEAFSFQVATDDQAETDFYWNAIVSNGGTPSACGWCKDRWGVNWQITPRRLSDALSQGGNVANRVFRAMMSMGKIDIVLIEAAIQGALNEERPSLSITP